MTNSNSFALVTILDSAPGSEHFRFLWQLIQRSGSVITSSNSSSSNTTITLKGSAQIVAEFFSQNNQQTSSMIYCIIAASTDQIIVSHVYDFLSLCVICVLSLQYQHYLIPAWCLLSFFFQSTSEVWSITPTQL